MWNTVSLRSLTSFKFCDSYLVFVSRKTYWEDISVEFTWASFVQCTRDQNSSMILCRCSFSYWTRKCLFFSLMALITAILYLRALRLDIKARRNVQLLNQGGQIMDIWRWFETVDYWLWEKAEFLSSVWLTSLMREPNGHPCLMS